MRSGWHRRRWHRATRSWETGRGPGDGQVELADNDWPALVPGLPPGNGITRPRLHKILQSQHAQLRRRRAHGVTFTALDDRGDRVDVEFTDGETRSYDLVVGADGL